MMMQMSTYQNSEIGGLAESMVLMLILFWSYYEKLHFISLKIHFLMLDVKHKDIKYMAR